MCSLVILFMLLCSSNAFIFEFMQKFNASQLENHVYDAITIPMLDHSDQEYDMAKEIASSCNTYYAGHSTNTPNSTLVLLNHFQIEKYGSKHNSSTKYGQFIKDQETTFFLYTFVGDLSRNISDPTYYSDLKMKFPKQPIIYIIFRTQENIFTVYEAQIYAKKSVKIASWNSDNKTITYFNTNLFQRRQNLTGVVIATSHRNQMPYFSFNGTNGELDGANGKLASIFQKKFNFTFEWSKFVNYGSLSHNGTWTGTVKDLIDHKLDFSGVDLTHETERVHFVSPGFTLTKVRPLLWFNKLEPAKSSWFALTEVFDQTFWCAVGIVMGLFFLLLQAINRKRYRAKDATRLTYGLHSFSLVLKSFMGQSENETNLFSMKESKKFTSVSIIVFSLSLTGAMVFMTYSGCLTSILAIQNYAPPFTSLKEMRNMDNPKIFITYGSGIQSAIISLSKEDPDIEKVYEKYIEPHVHDHTALPSILKEFSKSADEFSAMLQTEVTFNLHCEKLGLSPCNFMKFTLEEIPGASNGWMYPKGSILQPLFDRYMEDLTEKGVVEQIRQTFFKKPPCTSSQDFTEIGFDFVKTLFVILCSGMVTAIIVSLAERCLHKKTKQQPDID